MVSSAEGSDSSFAGTGGGRLSRCVEAVVHRRRRHALRTDQAREAHPLRRSVPAPRSRRAGRR